MTYIKSAEEGFIGTLIESNIDGPHFELKTEQGVFVLAGNTKGLKDYVGDKIVVKGELKDGYKIYLRGIPIDVEEFYPLRARDFVTFDVDADTKVAINGKNAKLSDINVGDFAQVRADEDYTALEIKADSRDRIKEWKEERKTIKDGKLEGKVVAVNLGHNGN